MHTIRCRWPADIVPKQQSDERSEVFMAAKIQVDVFGLWSLDAEDGGSVALRNDDIPPSTTRYHNTDLDLAYQPRFCLLHNYYNKIIEFWKEGV
jgi:hypothetical protein